MMSHLIYWFNSFILILLQLPRLTENDSVAFGRTTRIRTEDGISPLDYESSTCNRTVSVLYLARVERFELPTCYVEDNCSIQLNYTLFLLDCIVPEFTQFTTQVQSLFSSKELRNFYNLRINKEPLIIIRTIVRLITSTELHVHTLCSMCELIN